MASCIRNKIVAQTGEIAKQGDVKRCCEQDEGDVLDAKVEV